MRTDNTVPENQVAITSATIQKRPTLLFTLGQTLATPGALSVMQNLNIDPSVLLTRHLQGDWSEMDKEDQASNQEAIEQGFRVFSAYTFNTTKIWVITEADRSSTTLLLPEEY